MRVSGLVAESQHFIQTWHQLTGQTYPLAMRLRIHRLTTVQPIVVPAGKLRHGTIDDRPLLLKWYTDFTREAIPSFLEDVARSVDNGLKAQSIYLWEDGQPVSLASGRKALPLAGRIGPVYTPLEYRRKGYATACVAALSQRLLNQGCKRCFLFTDLANPTSNHIYQTIGYQPICDWHEYGLG
ncbi:GNAT family N-acetyltransferase [Leptolyngbya sp. GB1-A1]|uniref:GNAT family N-acetyltransferase n=1 Tax=Leptolyngbya sp. GB1-A1 TaxID=2933908 RepID=UPI00329A1B32